MKKRKVLLAFLIILLVLIVAFCVLFIAAGISTRSKGEEQRKSRIIEYEGKRYYPKQDITIYLVIGIDDFGSVEAAEYMSNKGQSDFLAILSMNHSEKTCSVLELNRDTMTNVQVLGMGGRVAGTAYQQLALAHTYGTGMEDSCENTVETVSSMLYNLKIDHYVSMNMDTVAILTDAVGGVTLEVTDDFSDTDSSIGMGLVHLNGTQALHYVRGRMSVGDGSNLSRISRQMQFMTALIEANTENKLSAARILELYDELAPYVVTNCSSTIFNELYTQMSDYTFTQVYTIEGEATVTDKFMEFYMDEDDLLKKVIQLFYSEMG